MLVPIGILLSLVFNISIAFYLANDQPNDGKLYAQLATNLLVQSVFSVEAQAPFTPTLIRLPGYPLFLAGVYSVFGQGNNSAVRVVQAVVYVVACLLVALIAWNWCGWTKRRRRKAAYLTFILAAFCPFTAIYAATILTETLTMFFLAAMTLAATYGLISNGRRASILWWACAGLLAGFAVLMRPDSGLFALGLGLTLVISVFIKRSVDVGFGQRLLSIFVRGIVFSVVFALVLLPWTIRNEQVFGLFQPLAPAHAEMPGEFVPRGYLLWVRTWIDDSRYIGPVLWDLEEKQIKIEQLPAYAFSSVEEKAWVAALLDQYNNSDPDQQKTAADDKKNNGDSSTDNKDDGGDAADDNAPDEPDPPDDGELDLKISPEVDTGFQQIAEQRIANEPAKYYVALPAKRAASMWFDTHSEYYPFGGEMFPVKDLDNENYQNLWLPLLGSLMWIYTLLAFGGAIILLKRRTRLWLIMTILLCLPRTAFFGTLENPEPRYLVEMFILAAILGGILLSRFRIRSRDGSVAIEFLYQNG